MNRAEACAVLEVFPACSDAELKAAYHRKVKYWHPDNFVASQEILPEMKRFAEQQMRRVIEAFKVLTGPEADQTVVRPLSPEEMHPLVQQVNSITESVRKTAERLRTVSERIDRLTRKLERAGF